MNQLDYEATKIFSFLYNNPMVKIPLLILLAAYFVISPKLPNFVFIMYDNIIFKILIVLLIIFLSNHDKQLALMVTAVYLLTVFKLNKTEYFGNSLYAYGSAPVIQPVPVQPPKILKMGTAYAAPAEYAPVIQPVQQPKIIIGAAAKAATALAAPVAKAAHTDLGGFQK